MQPVQLLVQNLLYDFSQTGIPFDGVDEEYLRKPRRWKADGIARFMLCLGPVSSLFDYATFLLMWFVFQANSIEKQSLFQTGWFVEGLLSQTLIVHIIRTRKVPFLQSRASGALMAMTGLVVAAGLAIPFTALGSSLGMQRLPGGYFPWLLLILISYCALGQLVKRWYDKRFGYYE
jgi:Mg2+-importing ATPase